MTWVAGLFGVVMAAAIAAGVHLRWGRGCGTWAVYTVMAEAGFWAGHGLANRFDWTWGRWGPLALGPAVLSAILLVGLTAFLLYTPPTPSRPASPWERPPR